MNFSVYSVSLTVVGTAMYLYGSPLMVFPDDAAVDLAVAVRSRSIPVSIREPQIVLPTRVLRPQRLDA